MKRMNITLLAIFAVLFRMVSQEADPGWGIKFSGFVKTDVFYDTRQASATNSIREGHFFLYPDNALYDAEMNDLNANPSFHILNIQTRVRGDITGPDAFGAKTSAAIEAEFFGTSETDLNGFRLRHAYVKLDWQKTALLVGQYWHPMFPAESFPGTLSFNTGAPFNPFSRNPQVNLTQKIGKVSFSFIAYAQRDFTSAGPDGNSNKYMRNSGLPGAHVKLRAPFGSMVTVWAGFDYKTLRPEIKTVSNVETDATIGSAAGYVTLGIKTKPLNLSFMGTYAQNATDLVMIGGYAVSEVVDTVQQLKNYTNLNTLSFWTDLATKGKKVTVGLFAGYSKNLGAGEQINGPVYGRGNNIDHLFRISPRIVFTDGRFSVGTEIETTAAAYGNMNEEGLVTQSASVTNVRVLVSAIYRF